MYDVLLLSCLYPMWKQESVNLLDGLLFMIALVLGLIRVNKTRKLMILDRYETENNTWNEPDIDNTHEI